MSSASTHSSDATSAAEAFIKRWRGASGETANAQSFFRDLCDLLGVPRPDPRRENDTDNAYCFEKHIVFHNGDGTTSSGNIDLYKRDCFVLNGLIRYLRPEYQAPGARPVQQTLEQEDIIGIAAAETTKPAKLKPARDLQIKLAWPTTLAEQAQAIRTALAATPQPITAPDLARQFKSAQAPKVAQILETLATLGQARRLEEGLYAV